MQAKRKQIRRRGAADSDDTDSEGGKRDHESAIAALKAKRQPASKFKRHTLAANVAEPVDTNDSLGSSEPTNVLPIPVQPVQLLQPTSTESVAKKPDVPRKQTPLPEAKALPRIRGVNAAYAQAENAMGFEPLPEFIPLDSNRRPSGTQLIKGRTKLEAMVYSSSDEEDDSPAVASVAAPPSEYDQVNERVHNLRAVREQSAAVSRPTAPPHSSAQPATLHDLLEKYSDMLQGSKEVLDRDLREQTRVVQDLSTGRTLLAKFDVEVTKAADEFEFFQSVRKWIRALCGFLTVKLGEIASIEAALDASNSEGLQLTTCRQAADLLDEIAECEVRGDIKVVVIGLLPDMPAEIPFGAAELPPGHVWRPEARVIKRRSRLARRDTSLDYSPSNISEATFDALSDCEESDSEAQSMLQRRGGGCCAAVCCGARKYAVDSPLTAVDVLEPSYDVMADSLAEYSNAATVRDKFVKWKTDFPKSYEDAYVSLSLQDVFSPFVRLEVRVCVKHILCCIHNWFFCQLLSWSPCTHVTLLNEFEWFPVVWQLVEAGADLSDRLIPSIVSRAVVPRLCAFVRLVWNPLSRKQSRCLRENINEVLTVEPSGDAIQVCASRWAKVLVIAKLNSNPIVDLQELTQAVVDNIRSVAATMCIPVFIRRDAGGGPSLAPLTVRQFARACKVSVVLSGDSCSEPALMLLLSSCLHPCRSGMASCPLERWS